MSILDCTDISTLDFANALVAQSKLPLEFVDEEAIVYNKGLYLEAFIEWIDESQYISIAIGVRSPKLEFEKTKSYNNWRRPFPAGMVAVILDRFYPLAAHPWRFAFEKQHPHKLIVYAITVCENAQTFDEFDKLTSEILIAAGGLGATPLLLEAFIEISKRWDVEVHVDKMQRLAKSLRAAKILRS